MNKINELSFSFKVIRLGLAMLLLIVTACKKDVSPRNEILSELQQWYQENKTTNNNFVSMNPVWDSVYTNDYANQLVYELRLSNPKHVYQSDVSTDKMDSKTASKNNFRLLIFKDKKSKKLTYGSYMSTMNEGTEPVDLSTLHYKNAKGLTGKIMFFDMEGKFANGWEYYKGKLTKKLSTSLAAFYSGSSKILSRSQKSMSTDRSKQMIYLPPTCAFPQPDYRTSCVGVEGYMECTTYLAGYFCVDPAPGGGEGGGNDGGYTPPGGGTGSGDGDPNNSTSRDLNTDSLKAEFPCVEKLVLQPIFGSQSMANFIEPFLTGLRPTISYKTGNLTWGNVATGGMFKLGETGYDPNSGLNLSTVVTLNKKMLEKSSPLIIAATTVHETIHSFIYYNISMAESNVKANFKSNGNWMASLNGYYLVRSLPPNYSNHTEMLNSFFDKAIDVLRQWDDKQNSQHSDKELAMAMLYGLNTADPGTSQSLINNLNSAYALAKLKYLITDSELEAFNVAQLESINKIPKTGCK